MPPALLLLPRKHRVRTSPCWCFWCSSKSSTFAWCTGPSRPVTSRLHQVDGEWCSCSGRRVRSIFLVSGTCCGAAKDSEDSPVESLRPRLRHLVRWDILQAVGTEEQHQCHHRSHQPCRPIGK